MRNFTFGDLRPGDIVFRVDPVGVWMILSTARMLWTSDEKILQ